MQYMSKNEFARNGYKYIVIKDNKTNISYHWFVELDDAESLLNEAKADNECMRVRVCKLKIPPVYFIGNMEAVNPYESIEAVIDEFSRS